MPSHFLIDLPRGWNEILDKHFSLIISLDFSADLNIFRRQNACLVRRKGTSWAGGF